MARGPARREAAHVQKAEAHKETTIASEVPHDREAAGASSGFISTQIGNSGASRGGHAERVSSHEEGSIT